MGEDAVPPPLSKGQAVSAVDVHIRQAPRHGVEARGHDHRVKPAFYGLPVRAILRDNTPCCKFLNDSGLEIHNVNIALV
jgi:hypothetical protein